MDFLAYLRNNIIMHAIVISGVLGEERIDLVLRITSLLRLQAPLEMDWAKLEELRPAGRAILSLWADLQWEYQTPCIHRNVPAWLKALHLPFIENKRPTKLETSAHTGRATTHWGFCSEGGIDLRYLPVLQAQTNLFGEDHAFAIQLVLNELMQNAVDHSSAERYYYYFGLHENEIHLGMLDMGVSLPAKLEQHYDFEDDLEALEMSFKLGVTTRRMRKGGLGLNHTFEMVKDRLGKLVIVSRDAQLRRYFSQRKVYRHVLKDRLHGT